MTKGISQIIGLLFCFVLSACQTNQAINTEPTRLETIKSQRLSGIKSELEARGLKLGNDVFVRIYKQTSEFELWIKNGDKYTLYKNYPICKFSGNLGPKLKEGDKQAPEGIYYIEPSQLHPTSDYHLAFNLGYPNEFDKSYGRTGSFLMVHGNCLSVGCYAMTDYAIEEIYIIVEAALNNKQKSFPVIALPFRNISENQTLYQDPQWGEFWRELANIDAIIDDTKIFPKISHKAGHYVIVK